jgi:hypothetical protein
MVLALLLIQHVQWTGSVAQVEVPRERERWFERRFEPDREVVPESGTARQS